MAEREGYADTIVVMPNPDGRHGVYHLYKPAGLFSGGDYIDSVPFDARNSNDIAQKFEDSKRRIADGYINTAASDTAKVLQVGVAVAMVFIPGPQEAVMGAVVSKMAGRGITMVWRGGKWLYKQ